jgi:hypothetical protein
MTDLYTPTILLFIVIDETCVSGTSDHWSWTPQIKWKKSTYATMYVRTHLFKSGT